MTSLITKFKTLSSEEQLKTLLYYQDQYENDGPDQIEDATFDTMVKIYEKSSGAKYEAVGFLPSASSGKETLPFYMGSLDKVKGETAKVELSRWTKTYNGPWVIEDKIDGVSALYIVSRKNKMLTQKLYTRGNGTIGTNISHLIPYLNLPIPDVDIAIRGEIVINHKDFEEYNASELNEFKFKNARNAGSGVINSKELNVELAKKLKFYAYNILNWDYDKINQEFQLGYLRTFGFEVPWYAIVSPTNPEENIRLLEEYLKMRKSTALYDIDGLVIVNNGIYDLETDRNPRHMIAFKVDVYFETTVLSVEWEASKDGVLKPVVIYEPIETSGVKMSRASGKNAKFIVNNSIGPGAEILITRAGDVIPDIVEILRPAAMPSLPEDYGFSKTSYTWNENVVEFVLINPEENVMVQKGKIEYFMTQMDIKNVGPGRIALLFEHRYDTLYKILSARPENFAVIPGLGEKSGQQIYNGIHSVISNAPLANVMAGSGIFGSGFGVRKMTAILEIIPNILEFENMSVNSLTELILTIPGFDKTSVIFAEKLKYFCVWLRLHSMIKISIPLENKISNGGSTALSGLKIVFTGFRSSELEQKIKEQGGNVVSAINKSTSILVAKSLDDLKGKAEKAKEFGIPIMTRDEFQTKYFP